MEKKSLLRCAKDNVQLRIREMYDLRSEDLHFTEIGDHYKAMGNLSIAIENMDSVGEIISYIELGGLHNIIDGSWEEDIASIYYQFSSSYLKQTSEVIL